MPHRHLIDLDKYEQGTGSIQYHLIESEGPVEKLDNPRLREKYEIAQTKTDRAATLEYNWQKTKDVEANARQGAVETDNKCDRLISAIYRIAKSHAEAPGESDEKEFAERLVDEVFDNNGVYNITSAKFDEQRMHVSEMLEQLRGECADCVEALNLTAKVEKLAELNETFGEQLSIRDHDTVTYDEVQAARQEARQAYQEFLYVILGDYCDDPETLDELLAPFHYQQERIAQYVQKRGEVPDVDPNSGEPTDPDQPIEPPEPTEEPVDDGETVREPVT